MNKIILFILVLLCNAYSINSQEITLSGTIVDSADKLGIPFAHIGIDDEMAGTIANENGQFEIKVSADTKYLNFTALGYEENKYKVRKSETNLEIKLDLWSNTLAEATVMPKTAKEYVKLAINRHSSNITSEPFSTQSYFSSSQIMENKGLKNVKKHEAVFRTYYPNYADTSFKNQNRLLLHNFTNDSVNVDISMIDNKKVKRKMTKLSEKQEKKNAKREERLAEELEDSDDSEETDTENTGDDGVTVEANPFAGGEGPEFVLYTFQNLTSLNFLDSAIMERIDFSIGKPSFYKDKELITINFSNEKPIMLLLTYNGTIYLDSETLAIVSIEYTENVNIPKIFRPLVKAKTGINIAGYENEVSIQNQLHDSLWYPQQIIYLSTINLKKGKAFKKDEHLYLSSRDILSVEKVTLDESEEIIPEFLYDSKKGFEEQVFPLDYLKWGDVNVVN